MVSAVPLVKPASNFPSGFAGLTGNPPYPWQQKLFDLLVQGEIPPDINLPTGSGKTSIMPIWLLDTARFNEAATSSVAEKMQTNRLYLITIQLQWGRESGINPALKIESS